MKYFFSNTLILTLLVFIFFSNITNAQQRTCHAMEVLEQQLQQNPILEKRMNAIEEQTQKVVLQNQVQKSNGLITIPVVVHVVYNHSSENISDSQVLSQIQVLNEDFQRLNADADNTWAQAADVQIEFCLASTDPDGYATTGITRKYSNTSNWGTDDGIKYSYQGGTDAWPSSDYLNIWIGNIGNDILGYAQFPGGMADTDGVVIAPQYFGTNGTAEAPFNLGRTSTHEIGHWLNLRHIWGDGDCSSDDWVNDTPLSDEENYGCDLGHLSCNSTDMVQNYMDYSADACMNLFTQGQKNRMRALFDQGGFRASLLKSKGCSLGAIHNAECNNCDCTQNTLNISINLDDYPAETSWTLNDAAGNIIETGGPYDNQTIGSNLNIVECLPDACYEFTIYDAIGDGICCDYGNGSYRLLDAQENTLISGGDFSFSETQTFCLENIANQGNDGSNNTACSYVELYNDSFEGNWGIWNDGGSDCGASSYYANTGAKSLRLRDDSNSSVVTTDNLDLTAYEELTIDFSYYPVGMDNNEFFILQISLDGGSSYSNVQTWTKTLDFQNNTRYHESVVIPGPFSNMSKLRFKNKASTNNDRIYFDDFVVSACLNANRLGQSFSIENQLDQTITHSQEDCDEIGIKLFPNPTNDVVNFQIDLENMAVLRIINANGIVYKEQSIHPQNMNQTIQIDIQDLPSGSYFLQLTTEQTQITKPFVVL